MKISINTLEVNAEGTNSTTLSLTNNTFNAAKTGVTTKVVDTESFSSGEKAIVEAFVNLINSK